MTFQRRVVRTDETVDPVYPAGQEVVDSTTVVSPSGGELGRRLVVLIFGIIQLLILLRIVLLLLDAREGNDLVSFILNASQVFVAPFIGIFNTDALKAGGSILDIAAIAALVGWTVLEAIALWIVNLFRRETVV
jgi:YGGT family